MELLIPNHLGIIIDGNRRWARQRGLEPWAGHWRGVKKLERFLQWCYELKIPQVSVYVLSTENLNRPKKEVEELFKIFMHYLEKWEKGESDFLKKYKVKVRFIGDLERLPPQLVNLMAKVMQKTAKYQRRVLNVLVAYGGRFELLQAAKRIAKKALETGKVEVTEKELEKFLFVPTPVDLLIRTGGEQRISNFMPYQIAYSEIIFVEKLWPAFCKRDFLACIKEYTRRERRFGL